MTRTETRKNVAKTLTKEYQKNGFTIKYTTSCYTISHKSGYHSAQFPFYLASAVREFIEHRI